MADLAACSGVLHGVELNVYSFEVLSAYVFPFNADVKREKHHRVHCLQKQVHSGGVLGCGFMVRLFWSGWVTNKSCAFIIASSSFPGTNPNELKEWDDSSWWHSLQRAHLVVSRISWNAELFLDPAAPASILSKRPSVTVTYRAE